PADRLNVHVVSIGEPSRGATPSPGLRPSTPREKDGCRDAARGPRRPGKRESPSPALEGRGGSGHARRGYLLSWISSCSSSSDVVIMRELAWKPRWARIISVNCCARFAFDISRLPLSTVPNPWPPGCPIIGRPELTESWNALSPTRVRPPGFVNRESAIRASGWLKPFEKMPLIVPSGPIVKLVSDPASWPSCFSTFTVDCWAKPVIDDMKMLIALVPVASAAPLLNWRFMVPSGWVGSLCGWPPVSNVTVPEASGFCVTIDASVVVASQSQAFAFGTLTNRSVMLCGAPSESNTCITGSTAVPSAARESRLPAIVMLVDWVGGLIVLNGIVMSPIGWPVSIAPVLSAVQPCTLRPVDGLTSLPSEPTSNDPSRV